MLKGKIRIHCVCTPLTGEHAEFAIHVLCTVCYTRFMQGLLYTFYEHLAQIIFHHRAGHLNVRLPPHPPPFPLEKKLGSAPVGDGSLSEDLCNLIM